MSSSAQTPYLPLLEGYSGNVYLTNSEASGVMLYVTGGGSTATPAEALANHVVDFSSPLGLGQGKLNLFYDLGTDTTQLQYNGGTLGSPNYWDAQVADNFSVSLSLTDIAYVNSKNEFDLYTFIPAAGGINGAGVGGSQYTFDVWALCLPTVASISPANILTDESVNTITISLVRRLHSSQKPVCTPSITGSGVTLSAATPIYNSSEQIVGYTMTAIASDAQPTSTQTITFAFSETLTYLTGDTIVSGVMNYPSSTKDFTVTSQSNVLTLITAPYLTLSGGSGTDTYHGIITSSSAVIAGGLTAQVTLTSGIYTNLTAPVNIVVQEGRGSHSSITQSEIAVMTPISPAPILLADKGVYQQTYYANFQTAGDPALDALQTMDIGVCATGATNAAGTIVPKTWWFGPGNGYINGNLTADISAYTIFAVAGENQLLGSATDTYYISADGTSEIDNLWSLWPPPTPTTVTPAFPTFSGITSFYIDPNWNPLDVITGAPSVITSIKYSIDGGTLVASNLLTNYTVKEKKCVLGLCSVDTTLLSEDTHTLNWSLTIQYDPAGTSSPQTITQSGAITFEVNQLAQLGIFPDFIVTSKSLLTETSINGGVAQWNLTCTPTSRNMGWSGTITYSLKGYPAGSIYIFSPATASLTSASEPVTTTLSITTPAVAWTGDIYIYATATSGTAGLPVKATLVVTLSDVVSPPFHDPFQ